MPQPEQREIITTADGSTTIQLKGWNEQYHSLHGAVREAYHVFIGQGLSLFGDGEAVSILEVGLGTGLNAFITLLEAQKRNLDIRYTGVEAYPISDREFHQLNYTQFLGAEAKKGYFEEIHRCPWETELALTSHFRLLKRCMDVRRLSSDNAFDLVYFDAFGARVQPELWTEAVFATMFNALKANGLLVTYSAKGSVRRALQAVGFTVERLPGPPGKREMLRGRKE